MRLLTTALLLGIAASVFAQEPPIFAFADRDGAILLALNVDSEGHTVPYTPQQLTKAVCAGNRLVNVAFEKHQKSGPQNTGRQTSANFEQLEGDRFRIVGAKTSDDDVCLLLSGAQAEGLNLVPFKASLEKDTTDAALPNCSAELISKLSAKYGRKTKRCSVLAMIDNMPFVAAEFEPDGKSLLVVEALQLKDSLAAHPEPAECQDGSSAWRVDDECQFDPSSLVPLFAWKRKDGAIELGVEWRAPEGGSLLLFRVSGDALQPAAKSYRYWAAT